MRWRERFARMDLNAGFEGINEEERQHGAEGERPRLRMGAKGRRDGRRKGTGGGV